MILEPSRGIKIVTDSIVDLQRFTALAGRRRCIGTVYTCRFTLRKLPVNTRVHRSGGRASIYI